MVCLWRGHLDIAGAVGAGQCWEGSQRGREKQLMEGGAGQGEDLDYHSEAGRRRRVLSSAATRSN